MFFHVRFTQKSQRSHDETKNDLSEEQLMSRFIEPYQEGQRIIINGKTIQPNDIERVRISKSEEPSGVLIDRLKRKDRESPIAVIGGPSYEWRAANEAVDVTDEYITGAPGDGRPVPKKFDVAMNGDADSAKKRVFIVHGHDHSLKNDLEVFLTRIGLEPVVLHREADGGLTVIEKFERYANVRFAFVLLTPDDIAFEAGKIALDDKGRDMEYRARQNVLFEFGYFVGKLGRSKVCCLYKEGVALPSDLSGLLYKRVPNSVEEIGYALINELKVAGLEPQM